jgi:hypothetical protein
VADQWQQIAVTWNGSIITVYYNGQPDGTAAFTQGPIQTSTGDLEIGFYSGGVPVPYFYGSIDEVRIYNYALSASEIQALYNEKFGQITDPTGDAIDDNRVSPDPDLVSATGTVTGTDLVLNVQFAPGTFSTASSCAGLLLDTDMNPATGHKGVNSGCIDDASLIGSEFLVNMEFYGGSGQATLWKYMGTCNYFNTIGTFSITVKGNGMETTIPMALLSGDGRMNFKVTSYAALSASSWTGCLDYMTNIGSPVGMIR